MNDRQTLLEAPAFHGHRCWASTAGVRIGLAALRALGVQRSDTKALHAIVETGDHHGAMCFADEQPLPRRTGRHLHQPGQYRAVGPVELRPGHLAAQHRELVAQHQRSASLAAELPVTSASHRSQGLPQPPDRHPARIRRPPGAVVHSLQR